MYSHHIHSALISEHTRDATKPRTRHQIGLRRGVLGHVNQRVSQR